MIAYYSMLSHNNSDSNNNSHTNSNTNNNTNTTKNSTVPPDDDADLALDELSQVPNKILQSK